MKVLGIRTAPGQLRYAIIESNEDQTSLLNASTENLIKVPAGMEDYSEKLAWQKEEVDRILRQNPDIDHVVMKVGEYGRSDTKSSRLGAYFDAAVILAAKEQDIPVEGKIYKQVGTKRAEVKNHAEELVGKTDTHWNEQIADAIVAACSVRSDK
ncbi:hypothetical protein SAMN03080615_04352 [Amphritea atlantica]|uniref:Holliday junction resolvase RuvC n=1 Tax=Amphritea atlantica TaxID=355243 RepID=A0A1H9MAX1_9GAMM|nr:hypothetical protein [Amphritea atlantica]SER20607.1 hypothetical protein SAMN03080615_04352 [Amphritea atlantica]